jgi:dTDP-glucose 4,6-dehydratase
MKTWIVTGGAGFIGCNFVRAALAGTDHRVVVFDKLTYAGSLENLRDVEGSHSASGRYEFVRGDIADRAAVRALFERTTPDAIVNFAAESHVDRSIDSPGEFIETNIRGTFELLEAARDLQTRRMANDEEAVRNFRFLHVSTDEVFGSLGPEGAFSETTPYAPNSPYSASKASADHLVRAYHHTFSIPTLVTNCSNNYGPYQFPEKLIPVMLLNALEGRDLPIYGNGSNVRDWLHVADHCQAILRVLEHGVPGSSYNVGGNQERTNLEVVDTLCAVLEDLRPARQNGALMAAGKTSYPELKRFVRDRPGHDQRYAIDASKIETELGWKPQHDFASGLHDTVEWYLGNAAWCSAVQDPSSRHRIGLGTP